MSDATPPLRPTALDPTREARLAVLETYLTPTRQQRLEHALNHRITGVAMVIDGIHDLGNASAIMRTCDGLGIHRVYLVEQAEKYRIPKRGSQGSHKWLEIHRFKAPHACAAALRQAGYTIAGASLDTTVRLDDLDVSQPIALVLGNEHSGLSPAMINACDTLFRIDMHGLSQSFNVSVAAALTLQHVLRRRPPAPTGRRGDMATAELDALREIFYRKAVQHADAILERTLGAAPPPLPKPGGIVTHLD